MCRPMHTQTAARLDIRVWTIRYAASVVNTTLVRRPGQATGDVQQL